MTVYVFALGINTYRDPITSLKCCEHDARSVVALFKEGFGYEAEYLEERKAEDIIDRLKALRSKVQSGDTFVFYFSGHGKAHKTDQYLLLPGADLDVLDDQRVMGIGVLSYTALKRLTSGPGWQGVHRVFILDACRSALMADKTGDAAVCDSEFLIRDMALSMTSRLPVDQAFTVINSCALGATAYEIPATKHGLFTSSLLAGLRKAKESSQHALIDEKFVQSIGTDMAVAAVEHGMPQVFRHQPVFGGQPVTLRATTSLKYPDEDLEWDLCQAVPTVERLERFLRSFPQSQRRAGAFSMLGALHSGQTTKLEGSGTDTANHAELSPPLELRTTELKHAAQAQISGGAQPILQPVQLVSPEQAPPAPSNTVVPPRTGATSPRPGLEATGNGISVAMVAAGALALGLAGLGLWKFLPLRPTTVAQAVTAAPAPAVYAAPPASRFRKLESLLQVAGCEACGEMSRVEAGSFEMGAAKGEPKAESDEIPRHRVTLKAFEIGRTVVTQGQWKAVMGNNPSHFKDAGDAWPVESVSWNDAQGFLKKLNQQTGNAYRLPSEAEWEFAARGGTSTAFWWGNSINPKQANYDGNQSYNGGAKGEHRQRSVKADSFEPNPWGLYNVHGNVDQWVQDAYHPDYKLAPQDRRAWEDGSYEKDSKGAAQRVLRGGSWSSGPWCLRSAYRNKNSPDSRCYCTGFRIARSL